MGLLASLLLVTSPMFLMLAGSLMAHLWSLVLGLVFCLAWFDLFLCEKSHETGLLRYGRIAAAGCALGMLVITRPLTAMGIAAPFFVHGIIMLSKGDHSRRMAVLWIGLQAAAFCLVLPLWQAALTGDPWRNLYTLWWPYDRYGFGAGIGVADSGHSLQLARWNTRLSLESGARDLFGWFSFSWILLPAGLWAHRKSRELWLLLGCAASLIMVYGGYWVGSWLYGPRYYFEGIPAACILSAGAFDWLSGWDYRSQNRWQLARRWSILMLLAVLVGVNIFSYLPTRMEDVRSINGMSSDSRWLLEELDSDYTLVFIETQESWWEYGLYVPLAPPFSDMNLQVVIDRGPEVNQSVIEANPGWEVLHVNLAGQLLPGMP
jgi:hypothetical protein